MLFVINLQAKHPIDIETLNERKKWQHSRGVSVLAEYWLNQETFSILVICKAPSSEYLQAQSARWEEDFNIFISRAHDATKSLASAPLHSPSNTIN